MRRSSLSISLVLFLCACGSGDKEAVPDATDMMSNQPDTSSDAADMASTIVVPPDRCTSGFVHQNGVSMFADRSTESGIAAINPEGVRLSVTDIDGDGWPDLAARRSGDAANSFADDGRRTVWLLRNKGDGTFEDVTRASGILNSRYTGDDTIGRPSEVMVFGDIDNDGDQDALSAFTNDGSLAEGSEIMINNGDGTYSPYGPQLAFHRKQEATRLGGASFVDHDRDGRLDLWLGHGFIDDGSGQDRLYQQDDSGAFVDVTEAQGLTTSEWTSYEVINTAEGHVNSWGTLAADLNGDGRDDLLSASYGRAPNHLWLGGASAFANHSIASGYAFDENQDWCASHAAQCYCQSNPATTGCSACPAPALQCPSVRPWVPERDSQPFRLGGNSGTTAVGDVDNDGDLDLLTTEIVHFDVGANSDQSELLINDGSGTFTRPGNAVTGLERPHTGAWNDGDITGALFDFDNDGRLDVLVNSTDYAGTRAWLWHQTAEGTFDRLDTTEGINHTSSHGVAIADFDRDGDLDLVVGHSANRCSSGDHCYPAGSRHIRFFENTRGQAGNWLQLKLVGGEGTNRDAIGAQVTIEYPDGRRQVHQIDGGHGHYGVQHDLTAHFGLGTACEVDVTVRWPNAESTQESFTLQTGYRWVVQEGVAPVAVQ